MRDVVGKFAGCLGIVALSTTFLLSFCPPGFSEDLEQGKKLFGEKCSRCHGLDGLGNPKMAAILEVPVEKINLVWGKAGHMSSYEIEALVDAGNHRMPTYRGKLDDIEIHNVARYVVALVAYEKQEKSGSPKQQPAKEK